MTWQGWATVGTVGMVLVTLAMGWSGPDLVLLLGLGILLVLGILDPTQALAGFANEGMITVAILFVIAGALKNTGGVQWVAQRILGRPKTSLGAQTRLMLPMVFLSGFMNNTPLVAMMLPVVDDWAKRCRIPASKLMIPLSYASILGGLCTLIGTSTNLIVAGLWSRHLQAHPQAGAPLGLLDITPLGLAIATAGVLYLLFCARWVLPDRKPVLNGTLDPREYTVEMIVEPGSPLVGRRIEEAGLRHLPGVYLIEIDRGGEVLPAVSHRERLQANDRLVFVGVIESVVDLLKTRGLKPAADQHFSVDSPRGERCLIESVVSDSCPLVGQTIREGRFRATYNAAIVALARNGERLRMKIGDIRLRPGDTLLLEAHPSFVDQQRNSRDFFLVSQVENSQPPAYEKAWLALAILAGMILCASLEWLSMLQAAALAAGLLIATRCITGASARGSLDWQTLLAIGAALGLGRALEVTGTANLLASALLAHAGSNPWLALAAIYFLTVLLTEVLTNNAAAVLAFPLALATAASLHANPMPFVMGVMVGASCGFATPLGYATHLMVYGPGGYRFSDFLRAGLPLDLLCGLVTVGLAPLIWPF